LHWPTGELAARIDRRVEQMFAAGLVEEVQGLLAVQKGTVPFSRDRKRSRDENWDSPQLVPQSMSKTARQAVGYREVIGHLEGCFTLAETIEQVKLHSRQLAKRQRTWFRSLPECRFVAMSGGSSAAETARRIEELIFCG
jgi:tRNA dimethylallyltransferase